MKIYFAASIRGGRTDVKIYRQLIDFLNQDNQVLTEHIGDHSLSITSDDQTKDAYIRNRDVKWLEECDLVVAETSHSSLGVGYELATAERLHKPVIILHNSSKSQLSAMINGTAYFQKIFEYQTISEAIKILQHNLS